MSGFWTLSDGRQATGMASHDPHLDTQHGIDFDSIKAHANIVDIIGQHVALKPNGREFKGCCPFHAEKTPSFHVVPEKGFAHCFGCGWSGDVIQFVMEFNSCDIQDAINHLTGGGVVTESPAARAERIRVSAAWEREQAYKRSQAITKARRIWENSMRADEHHPYLVRKGVPAHNLRTDRDGRLVVPIFDADGEIQSLQTIDDAGNKKFIYQAPSANGRMFIGSPAGRTIICEGYATGASIYEAVPDQVCVAFSLDNIEKVARDLVAKGASIVLAADIGLSVVKLDKLGEELNCPVAVPAMTENGADFNDQSAKYGVDSVARTIREAIRAHAAPIIDVVQAIEPGALPCDISNVDLLQPPGMVGEIADWIDMQTLRPRKNLSIAAALVSIGNIGGLRYKDDVSSVTANLFAFCVAGARTGKEGIQQGAINLMREAGVSGAAHGSIKSEQEVTRNLIRHQASFYVIDEVGLFLSKIKNAQTRGGASYLEGVPAVLMAAYSKAEGYMLLTGDVKDDLKKMLKAELSGIERAMEENEGADWMEKRKASIDRSLLNIDNGIEKPFVSMMGITTPSTFDGLMDHDMATNGFVGRSLIFTEHETVPRARQDFSKPPLPAHIGHTVRQIWNGGSYDSMGSVRVENYADKTKVPTDRDAAAALKRIAMWMEDQADEQKSLNGLEAIYLGAYELVAKVSLILAIPGHRRTMEHVAWAFAIVKRDVEYKIRLVVGNDTGKTDPKQALRAKIMNLVGDVGEKGGTILNRLRGQKRPECERELAAMVEAGQLICEDRQHPTNGRVSKFYKKPD